MDYKLTPTVIRTNARFRGPTELDKYTNFMNETVHDLKLLGNVMDRDEFIFTYAKGQTDFINNNMQAYYNGQSSFITANIKSAYQINKDLGSFTASADLMDVNWIAYGGCIKMSMMNGITLQSDGATDPSGIQYLVDVLEGQTIYLRMKAAKVSGPADHVSLGSKDVNQGLGTLQSFALPADGSVIYIGTTFTCQHKESIHLNIDAARGSTASSKILLSEVSVTLIDQNNVGLQPLNTVLKSRVNILEDRINNIIDNL